MIASGEQSGSQRAKMGDWVHQKCRLRLMPATTQLRDDRPRLIGAERGVPSCFLLRDLRAPSVPSVRNLASLPKPAPPRRTTLGRTRSARVNTHRARSGQMRIREESQDFSRRSLRGRRDHGEAPASPDKASDRNVKRCIATFSLNGITADRRGSRSQALSRGRVRPSVRLGAAPWAAGRQSSVPDRETSARGHRSA